MKTLIENSIKPLRRNLLIALALCCSALSPEALAAGPSPKTLVGEDRGNNNSAAEGIQSLNTGTTGQNNTAHGWYALSANTEGSNNTATGFQALLRNTTGGYNTANGISALGLNTTGGYNTATGFEALGHNTTGFNNTATGSQALSSNTTGSGNTANGLLALFANTTGSYNTATGLQALVSNTGGNNNTATGISALGSNTTGNGNTANGFEALGYNTIGVENTAVGQHALLHNTIGSYNTANGREALVSNIDGGYNTAVGYRTLFNNLAGLNNVALGRDAGYNSTGTGNIYIGAGMAGVAGENDTCYIRSIWGQTSSGGAAVFINGAGKLGTTTSSRRFKENIRPMDQASEALFALKPVTFRYKKEIDPKGIPQFGLVAEDVEKANADLVIRDKEGKVNTVRYEQVNAMLLNEFLKEHKKVEAQQATIAELKKGMAVLTAQFKEQSAQLEKVSTQVGMSKPALRVATNR